MKYKWIRSLASLSAAMCIVLALTLHGSAAPAVDVGRSCSLSVQPGSGEIAEDLAKAKVVCDLYRIGNAVKIDGYDGYAYEMNAPYAGLGIDADIDKEGWQDLAQKAANIALKGKDPDVPVVKGAAADGGKISQDINGGKLNAGLYLLVVREADAMDTADYVTEVEAEGEDKDPLLVTSVFTDEYTYAFSPVLVSIPGKKADENGMVSSANPGEWLYDLEVILKPERQVRHGSLDIIKNLRSYKAPDAVTFVFDVEAVLNDKTVYSDVVSFTFTGPGQKHVLLDKIPVGAQVTVTEVYSGSSYSPAGNASMTVPIEAEEIASVRFTNDYNGKQIGGHGITNRFVFDEEAGKWNWTRLNDNTEAGDNVTTDNNIASDGDSAE